MALACLLSTPVLAFQIAPLGSQHEEQLTKQADSTLAAVAGLLGVLIKKSVHEEITQLASECDVARNELAADDFCGRQNVGVASPFVIYGVRWNDLPPFALLPGEGNCQYLGKQVCKKETIRFSTQILCWDCLFKDAEEKAKTQAIAGCKRGPGIIGGNLMTRSHFGDLQFLHAMASREGVHPGATRAELLDWLEFAWKVSSREIAFGSVLHTVQDSFAASHAAREPVRTGEMCEGTSYRQTSRIIEFYTHAAQDGHLHDGADSREAMVAANGADQWADVVDAKKFDESSRVKR